MGISKICILAACLFFFVLPLGCGDVNVIVPAPPNQGDSDVLPEGDTSAEQDTSDVLPDPDSSEPDSSEPDTSPVQDTSDVLPDPDTSECGNGTLEGDEECDDGNDVDGDGCSSTCVGEVVAPCENGIQEDYNGHSYYFCPDETSRENANDACVAGGGHLVKIEDGSENDWLQSICESQPVSGNTERWIGLNRIGTFPDWYWHDNTAPSYFPKYEPNADGDWNDSSRECITKNVVASVSEWEGYWFPKNCGIGFPYICEYDSSSGGDE